MIMKILHQAEIIWKKKTNRSNQGLSMRSMMKYINVLELAIGHPSHLDQLMIH
jgi:hypothetical protein